jgi:hypothetical protein
VITDSRRVGERLRRYYPRTSEQDRGDPACGRARDRSGDERADQRVEIANGLDGLRLVGYLGTLQPRKNIDVLRARVPRSRRRETLAARHRWDASSGYEPDACGTPDPRIRYLGEIPDEELAPFLGALSCMVVAVVVRRLRLDVPRSDGRGLPRRRRGATAPFPRS